MISRWGFPLFLTLSLAVVAMGVGYGRKKWEEKHCAEISHIPAMDRYTSMGDRITIPAQTVLKCDDGKETIK